MTDSHHPSPRRPSALDRARRLVTPPPATGERGDTGSGTGPEIDVPTGTEDTVGTPEDITSDTDAAGDTDATDTTGDSDVDTDTDTDTGPGRPARPRPRPVGSASGPRPPGRRPAATAAPQSPQTDASDDTAADANDADAAEHAAVAGDGARSSRAGRNLPAAIGVGVTLGAVIVASLFLYRPSFAVIVGIAALYGLYELGAALRTARIRISLGPLLVGAAAMLVAAWERGTDGLAVAALVTVAGVLVWRIADGAHGYTRDAVASIFALLYVPLLAGFAVMLAHPHDGAARVLAFVGVVVCSDTGGYAAGVLFGKHPLAPVVSKAKTWEGFTGSVLACSAAGILILTLTFHEPWWKGLLFGLALVVTATLGDLGESLVKRDLDIKDMGRLLPGHGGIMDRLDSLLPCAAVAYLLLTHLAPV